jgi:hypothetical protein
VSKHYEDVNECVASAMPWFHVDHPDRRQHTDILTMLLIKQPSWKIEDQAITRSFVHCILSYLWLGVVITATIYGIMSGFDQRAFTTGPTYDPGTQSGNSTI